MRAAIMQPYFFPYIGYFQLIATVDLFIVLDDVQYIDRGWVNRNQILGGGGAGAQWLSMPVDKAPRDLAINQRTYCSDNRQIEKMVRQVEHTYRRAPYFYEVYEVVAACLRSSTRSVSGFNHETMMALLNRIEVQTQFAVASELGNANRLGGQDRILNLCEALGVTEYVNPIGGVELYDGAKFEQAGIKLSFLKARQTSYAQFSEDHIPYLSIVDVLMFNGWKETFNLLRHFDLVNPRCESLSSVPSTKLSKAES